jgi:hypothetical protein
MSIGALEEAQRLKGAVASRGDALRRSRRLRTPRALR